MRDVRGFCVVDWMVPGEGSASVVEFWGFNISAKSRGRGVVERMQAAVSSP